MTVPVSIRCKNPGAMWPCALATQFGSTSREMLKDAQHNQAAIFPTFEQGGAAQFALWAKNYTGKTLREAIEKWSGHNSSQEYAAQLAHHIPGLAMSTVISKGFLCSPHGLQFMKLQAQWEAGQPYPMTDAQWAKAQELAFGASTDLSKVPTPMPRPADAPQGSPESPKGLLGSLLTLLVRLVLSLFGKH